MFLIFEPATAWGGVVRAQRNWKSILIFYLLPMMLIVAVAEGIGLVYWGKSQPGIGLVKKFTAGEAVIYGMAQFLMVLLTIAVCAYFIKTFGETFHAKHTYTQAFTVVVYGLSPVFYFGCWT
ncbi:MAG: YIP1 family protein [Limisphaerales bacterium]